MNTEKKFSSVLELSLVPFSRSTRSKHQLAAKDQKHRLGDMKTAMNYRKGWKEFVQAENRQRSTRWCGGGGVIQPDDVVEDNVFMQGLIWAWPKVSLCNFFLGRNKNLVSLLAQRNLV